MNLVVDGVEVDLSAVIGALNDETLAACRAQMVAASASPLTDAVVRTDHPTAPGGPMVRVHRPAAAEDGPLPALLWLHGGGLVLGDRFQDDARFDRWCPRHGMVAVTVDYRLAPEHPYPGALADGYAALTWLHEHADVLGVDPHRIGIGGDSAGGGLAAAVTLLARDRRSPPVAFQLLVYPMLDDRQVTPSSRRERPIWPPEANGYGWRSYLGDRCGVPDLEPLAAPSRATDLTALPPAYVVVGTEDAFVDEDVRFAEGLRAAGHEVLNEVVLNQVLVAFGDAPTTLRTIAELQADGTCWCGPTVWQGRTAMRISVCSWATTDADVERSLEAMLRVARRCRPG